KTVGDFGRMGARPTHPELLDWLAVEFVRNGWSLKAMHRLMMTSGAYRQASTVGRAHEKLDPENVLLSRMRLRRMEAEVLYDSLLMVSGRLEETRFGPPDPVEVRKDGLVKPVEMEKGWRRSIYVKKSGFDIPTLLDSFDYPQMSPNCLEREETTVAPQALHLMNDAMIGKLADSFAARVARKIGPDLKRQIDYVYLTALSRPPSSEEKQTAMGTMERLVAQWAKSSGSPEEARMQALSTLCHTVMNSAAFLYVD
ncbi:MAG: DUF1553 domain-containing protein, partial [Acidobacteria bacterium]|nr:DUF1553 domain-containing protein [Acidobacteriota bacterium]